MTDQAERERPPETKPAKTSKPRAESAAKKTKSADGKRDKASAKAGTAKSTQAKAATGVRARVETWREMFKDAYFTIDRRTLGLTRICLGWFLIGDLFRRTPDWIHLFGNTGVLPTELILTRPQANGFSILHGFAANWELWALWAAMLATYVALLLGYKTKVAQVLSLLWVTSMNGRVLLIENGGYVVHNLLLLWTCFMPLGDRFSIDAMLASMKRKREHTVAELNDRTDMLEPFRKLKFTSLVALVLLLQLSAVYYFNKVHKTGPAWQFGPDPWNRYADMGPRAVHFVMYVDRMVNPLIADVRTHVPFFVYEQMTRSVLFAEMILAYLFLTPFPKVWARRAALVLVNFLHIGFGSTFVLGPFAWALCVFSTLLLQTEDWDLVNKVIRKEHRARTILFDPKSGAALWFCRVIKRMDRYDLLGFDELAGDEPKDAIVVERRDGTQVTGRQAFAEILAALPIGAFFAPLIAWPMWKRLGVGLGVATVLAVGIILPRASVQMYHTQWGRIYSEQWYEGIIVGLVFGLPVVLAGSFVEWAMVRGRWSRFFGMTAHDEIPETDPSITPVRQRVRWFGGLTRELIIAAMFLGAVNQALTELWVTKGPWGEFIASLNKTEVVKKRFDTPLSTQSEYMQPLAHKLRFLQGWFMFSPNPVMDDGTIVVDAVTVDGRHVDPFWGIAPDLDLSNAKSYGYSQIWSDYFNRIHSNRTYWDAMVDYMRRLPERTGNPNDKLVSGEVYWTHDMNPKWGTTESWGYGKDLMFTFGENGGAVNPPPPPPPKPAGS